MEEFFRLLPGIHIELDDGLMTRHITAINVHIITVLGVCTAISSPFSETDYRMTLIPQKGRTLTDHHLPIVHHVDPCFALFNQERYVEAVLDALPKVVWVNDEAEEVDPSAIWI